MNRAITWEEYRDSHLTSGDNLQAETITKMTKNQATEISTIVSYMEEHDTRDGIDKVVFDVLRRHILLLLSGHSNSYPYRSMHISEVFLILEDVYKYLDEPREDPMVYAKAYADSVLSILADQAQD